MLTDKEIKNAQPRDKAYKLSDGCGLHLEISPTAGKLWRLRYRCGGKKRCWPWERTPACVGQKLACGRQKFDKP